VKQLRVAFETQFASGTPTGLGVYAQKLASALAVRPDVDLVELRDANYDVWRFDRRVYWDQVRVPLLARASRADIVHFTGGTLPLRAPHPCVLTLHDLAWLHGAVTGRPHSRLYFSTIQQRLARQADIIATDTDVARSDIIEKLRLPPSKVAVAGAGVDDSWFEVPRAPQSPPLLLSVGTVEERKDLITAVRALAVLPSFKLVSAGPHTPYAKKVMRVATDLSLGERVELLGFVDDGTLRSLYSRAAVLIFPSLYEGFGLPPLQALAARLPVVASDIPVLREVLGDCAFFARPSDPASFANGVQAAARSDTVVRDLVERGQAHARTFTWARVAERMVNLYRQVLGVSRE
jgi:glycosyltransferase involved in cell wall biosynthesis